MRLLLSFAALCLSAGCVLADVTVFAAASLKTALDQITADYISSTGVPVVVSYGGSPALAKQISEGAPADLFLSASIQWMDDLAGKGLIQPDSRRDLLSNTLILVGPPGAATVTLDGSLDLVGLLDGGKLSMALVESVPAGQYGKEALESLGLWESVEASVVQSENVRAALKLVALGEAPYGVVYGSDATVEPAVAVVGTFPADSHAPITYPGALTVTAGPDAAAFLDHLASPRAMAVFAANGFLPLP
jgi:molybdate transport system substrate-binding protein